MPPPLARPLSNRTLLWLMFAASAVNYVGRTIMSIAGPDIARQFQFTEGELGGIFSAFSFGYALLMLPSGFLADRFGPARTLTICGLLTAALTLGTAFAATLTAFLAVRFLFGLATASLYPACGNLTERFFPRETHAGVQGLVVGGSSLGMAFTPILAAFLIARHGWQFAFVAVALLIGAFFLHWGWRVHDKPAETTQALGRLRLSRPLLLLAAMEFCIGYYYNFTDTWCFYYFQEVRHVTADQSALFTTLVQFAGAIMMPLGGWLSDRAAPRFGRKGPAFGAIAIGGALLVLTALAADNTAAVWLLTASLSFVVAAEGAFWWAVLAHGSASPGAAYGFANTSSNVAQFVAPLAFPWLAARLGWTASVQSAALALMLAACIWMLVPKANTCSDRLLHGQSSS